MVYLSEEKKAEKPNGNVKTADTSTQKEKTEPSTALQIPKKAIDLAKSVGIDLNQIVNWAQSVEARFKLIEEEMPQKVANKLVEVAQQRQRQMAEQMQQNPQLPQGQGGGIPIGQILGAVLGGGGGGGMDEELLKLNKEIMAMSIQRMKADIGFTEAIKNAVVSKIAGKAAAGIIEGS